MTTTFLTITGIVGAVNLEGLYNILVPVGYTVLFIMLFLTGFPFLLMVLARLEKQVIHQFDHCDSNDITYTSAYTRAVNDSAGAMGFLFCGQLRQNRGGLYQATAAVWLSPDRRTMLIVGGGKILKMDYKRMFLYSTPIDGPVLLTTDQSGEADLSRLLDVETLWNATLQKLYAFHQERLTDWEDELEFFEAEDFLENFEAIDRKRARVLVNAQMAVFLDYNQNEWRYTWKGAFALGTRYITSLDKEKMQAYRFGPEFKRPGQAPTAENTDSFREHDTPTDF